MSVPIRFDMVVVDEAQDFAPRWIGLLEALLDRDGPGRMLLLGDERQVVYRRGFVLPDVDDGWVTATMSRNCRNAHVIATLLRRKLGGAAPALAAPPGWGYRFVEEDNAGSIPGLVADVVDSWLADGREPSNIGVVTTSTALREAIEKRGGFATDPKDGDNLVRVGTAHRLKGLEFDSVVLAADSPAPAEALLYVGVSRARSELVVIGPGGLGEQLGWSEGDDTAEGAPG